MCKKRKIDIKRNFLLKSHLTQAPPRHIPRRTSLAVKPREETGVGMSHAHTSLNSGHKIQTQQANPTTAEVKSVSEHQFSVCGTILVV